MTIVEIHSGPVTHRSLMNKSKSDLASLYLELSDVNDKLRTALDEAERERDRLAAQHQDAMAAQLDELRACGVALERRTEERNAFAEQLSECAKYLKDGETPAQRIERECADSNTLLATLAQRTSERDAAIARAEAAEELVRASRVFL